MVLDKFKNCYGNDCFVNPTKITAVLPYALDDGEEGSKILLEGSKGVIVIGSPKDIILKLK